jgi:diguanylate cyclase (GGDEF)-like protein/PAS domain S-box-containing protein
MLGNRFYKEILDNLEEGVYVLDLRRNISYWNHGAERITGYASAEVLGKGCRDNILRYTGEDGMSLSKGQSPATHTIIDGKSREAQLYLHHKDGRHLPVLVRSTPLRDANQRIIGAVEIFSESPPKHSELEKLKKVSQMALLCPLTSLGNRRWAELSLRARLDEMDRYGWPFGLLFVDVDQFKRINDEHGHLTGDEVLRMVAQTLSRSVRSVDFVGRWGGEEFIAIIRNATEKTLRSVANRCRTLIENSSLIDDEREIRVTISIGATLARHEDSMETLLQRADQLMYQSKAAGRNRISCDRFTVTVKRRPERSAARRAAS